MFSAFVAVSAFPLASLFVCLITSAARTTFSSAPAVQTTRATRKNKNNKNKRNKKNNKSNQNNHNSRQKGNTTRTKLSLCSFGPLRPPPDALLQLFLFCSFVLSFLTLLASVHWCKDPEMSECQTGCENICQDKCQARCEKTFHTRSRS